MKEEYAPMSNIQHDLEKWKDRFYEERDRRYNEVNIEREKALKIKETADLAALGLAREIQTYKDEKANELREQISRERGHYVSREEYNSQHNALIEKMDSGFRPLNEFMTSQRSRTSAFSFGWEKIVSIVAVVAAIFAIYTSTAKREIIQPALQLAPLPYTAKP